MARPHRALLPALALVVPALAGVIPPAVPAAAAGANGWTGWVARPTAGFLGGAVTSFATSTGTPGTTVDTLGGRPLAIAITPNGQTAYVAAPSATNCLAGSGADRVVPVNLSTGRPGLGIRVGDCPLGVAISPNGASVYVTNFESGTVSVISTATNRVEGTLAAGPGPQGIAVTPSGRYAYVTNPVAGTVRVIDLTTGQQGPPGHPIFVGGSPEGIAITPDGGTVYVANPGTGRVVPISTATDTAGAGIPIGFGTNDVAVSPDGSTVYALSPLAGTVTPIATATNTPAPVILVGGVPTGVTFSPDGATAYVADPARGDVVPVTVGTGTPGARIPLGGSPVALAITPDQAPTASYTVTPAPAGSPTSFNASASSSPVGSLATYSWSFGDGSTAVTATPTTTHTYALPGTYTTRLVVTNTAGTSTQVVFTGQTVSRNGGPSAAASQSVAVPAPAPVVTGIFPTAGPTAGGTMVTISGRYFIGTSGVTFGGVAATGVTVVSDTTVTAVSPAGAAGTVDVQVTTPSGTSPTGPADQFTYTALPVVDHVAPSGGSTAGGTTVVITGANFTGATAVHFGTVNAPGFVVNTSEQITVSSPAQGPGTVDVTVTTPGGTSATSPNDQFTYETPPPVPMVTSVTPSSGPTSGGTEVAIQGTGLTGASAVNFGGQAAVEFDVVSATEIDALSPAAAAGTVHVTVTTPGGTSTSTPADQFTYVAPPAVTGVVPASGPVAGGTTVSVNGSAFTGATAVTFGGVPALFNVVTGSQISAVAPSAAGPGTVDVVVTTPYGTSPVTPLDQFTYVAPPVVTGLSPSSGPTAGGTPVTISGSGFTTASEVQFGSTPVAFTFVNDTTITTTAPAGSAGAVAVTVTTDYGTSTPDAGSLYTYIAPGEVTGVEPGVGPASGGTTVTISGSGFTGATAVQFGGVSAASFSVVDDSTIIALSPPGTPGTVVDVTVTTGGGTSAPNPLDQFTYLPLPVVNKLVPTAGPARGGNLVELQGSGLLGTAAVAFGPTTESGSSIKFVVTSDVSVLAVAPPGQGTVPVNATTPGGTSAATPAGNYTYVDGYWLVATDGGVFAFGGAPYLGSMGGKPLNKPIIGMAATPDGNGYWLVATDGGVFSFGDAQYDGSMGGQPLNEPIVGMAVTPDGGGYWLVATDGGVFTFGDAQFYGSTATFHLVKPIVGIAPTADGGGYWLVATDGGVFAFGDAQYLGSMGGKPLNQPVVGIAATPDGGGYWLVANDGGVFAFGDAPWAGSMAGRPLNRPAVSLSSSFDGNGYWLVATDGGVFCFGDAPFLGSMGGRPLNEAVIGITEY